MEGTAGQKGVTEAKGIVGPLSMQDMSELCDQAQGMSGKAWKEFNKKAKTSADAS